MRITEIAPDLTERDATLKAEVSAYNCTFYKFDLMVVGIEGSTTSFVGVGSWLGMHAPITVRSVRCFSSQRGVAFRKFDLKQIGARR